MRHSVDVPCGLIILVIDIQDSVVDHPHGAKARRDELLSCRVVYLLCVDVPGRRGVQLITRMAASTGIRKCVFMFLNNV